MIESLSSHLKNFPGTANQTHCFTHILNLTAKAILQQFNAPKHKNVDSPGDDALSLLAQELEDAAVNIFDDDEDMETDDENAIRCDSELGDGLLELEEELAELDEGLHPIRLLLTKVHNGFIHLTCTNEISL